MSEICAFTVGMWNVTFSIEQPSIPEKILNYLKEFITQEGALSRGQF